MNSAQTLDNLIANWKTQSLTNAQMTAKIAEACMGWPYVWGGAGQICTSVNRKSYADRSSCPSGESAVIKKRCQILNGSKSSCAGCTWYPNASTRFFDCRGFTRWVLGKVGISLNGAGATSQWNDNGNWSAKGLIKDMPAGQVCCVFMQDGNKMSHTGFHIAGDVIIHCSGEVKYGKTTDRGWTHFAIPKGMEGGDVPVPIWRATIRKGSTGDDVVYCQEMLIKLGYDVGASGADGKFGSKTKEAVIAFQKDHNLNPDGVVGPLTWDALEEATPSGDLYTVTIPHLPKFKAEALLSSYTGASMEKEG